MRHPHEPSIERALGATEDIYWRFDGASPLNFGSIARFEGHVDIDQFRLAIDAVQMRHPLLRVRIECDEHDMPWYRSGVGSIPLQILHQPAGEEWSLLENELTTPIDTEHGPLIRCILIKHDDAHASLISTYHHAVCDGRSATFLTRDILQSLKQQHQGESPDLEPLPLMEYYGNRIPTIEDYKSFDELASTAWKTLQAAANFMGRVGIPMGIRKYTDDIPLHDQKLIIEPRFVEPDLMKRIATKAKAEGVTMQCVLNAGLSLAVAEDSPTGAMQATTCSQVIDIRERLIPPVGEDCGCFATGTSSMHHLNVDSAFWPLARDVHRYMKEALDTPLPFFHPAMHRSFALLGRTLGHKGKQTFGSIIKKLHPEGLAVSNLGQVRIEVPGSPLKLTDFAFATNTNVLNYFNTSAATFGGRMTWSFSASSMLGRHRVARIADRTMERIVEALDE